VGSKPKGRRKWRCGKRSTTNLNGDGGVSQKWRGGLFHKNKLKH
jgi:hypothetical protein